MARVRSTRVQWHPAAEDRIRKVPFFIRPVVRRRIEAAARFRQLDRVTPELVEEMRAKQHG